MGLGAFLMLFLVQFGNVDVWKLFAKRACFAMFRMFARRNSRIQLRAVDESSFGKLCECLPYPCSICLGFASFESLNGIEMY